MEQRRGKEFIGGANRTAFPYTIFGGEFTIEFVTVDIFSDIAHETFVTDFIDLTRGSFSASNDCIFGTEFDLSSDSVFSIANGLAGTHEGADIVISTGLIIASEPIIVDIGSREAIHRRYRRERDQPLGEHRRRKPEAAHRPGQDSSDDC